MDVVIGAFHDVNSSIAPSFYTCQVDIFGPFKSYSNVNTRASIKIWHLEFCCCTTVPVDVRLMDCRYMTYSFKANTFHWIWSWVQTLFSWRTLFKVERKVRQIKKSININIQYGRLSMIQWETLMQQISTSKNNLPIGVNNRVEVIEHLHIITSK